MSGSLTVLALDRVTVLALSFAPAALFVVLLAAFLRPPQRRRFLLTLGVCLALAAAAMALAYVNTA